MYKNYISYTRTLVCDLNFSHRSVWFILLPNNTTLSNVFFFSGTHSCFPLTAHARSTTARKSRYWLIYYTYALTLFNIQLSSTKNIICPCVRFFIYDKLYVCLFEHAYKGVNVKHVCDQMCFFHECIMETLIGL